MAAVLTSKQRSKQSSSDQEMKQRVNRCMTMLSDRDTESMAASELDSIARSLTPDSIPTFLSAISDTRTSDKPPLRRHSLRLLSLLLSLHPLSSTSPHLPRILSSVLRRLRDADSSVRSACVDAVRSIASSHPLSLSPLLLPSLSNPLIHEQDHHAQLASALSLSAAVDSAVASSSVPDPDRAHHLQRLVPRLIKLLRSDAFQAKPALLSLLGSIAAAGGASNGAVLSLLVPCLVDFLGSKDWAARKSAAEALSRLAVSERDHLGGFKSSCVSSFEARRFDKVKIVRDSMNQVLNLWKDLPGGLDDDDDVKNALPPSQLQSNSSLRGSASDGRSPNGSRSCTSVRNGSPYTARKNKFRVSRSPPPDASPITTTRKSTPPRSRKISTPPLARKLDGKKKSDWEIEISVPHALPCMDVCEKNHQKSNERTWRVQEEQAASESNVRPKLEAKRTLFEKNCEDNASNLGGLKSTSHNGIMESSTTEASNGTGEIYGIHKDNDLSLIRKQLVQIENQQSSLLDLLQRFIGSSQNGMHCLETRVHGLEMALDEISHDLAVSSGRVSKTDSAVNTCCKLPGAEFLSSKFWRRTEGRYSSRFSISRNPLLADVQNLAEKKSGTSYQWEKQSFRLEDGFVVNPLAEINTLSRGRTEITTTNSVLKSGIQNLESRLIQDSNRQEYVAS